MLEDDFGLSVKKATENLNYFFDTLRNAEANKPKVEILELPDTYQEFIDKYTLKRDDGEYYMTNKTIYAMISHYFDEKPKPKEKSSLDKIVEEFNL